MVTKTTKRVNLKLILKGQTFPENLEWIIVISEGKWKYVIGFAYPSEPYREPNPDEVRIAVGCFAVLGNERPYVWIGKTGDAAQYVCAKLITEGVKCKVSHHD